MKYMIFFIFFILFFNIGCLDRASETSNNRKDEIKSCTGQNDCNVDEFCNPNTKKCEKKFERCEEKFEKCEE